MREVTAWTGEEADPSAAILRRGRYGTNRVYLYAGSRAAVVPLDTSRNDAAALERKVHRAGRTGRHMHRGKLRQSRRRVCSICDQQCSFRDVARRRCRDVVVAGLHIRRREGAFQVGTSAGTPAAAIAVAPIAVGFFHRDQQDVGEAGWMLCVRTNDMASDAAARSLHL